MLVASKGQREIYGAPPPPAGRYGCKRCGGLVITEHYMDLRDDTGEIDFTAWRCASCGAVVDPVILKNRQAPPPNLLYGTKARKCSRQVKEFGSEKREENVDGADERQN